MSGPTEEKAIRFGIPDRWLYCPKLGQIVEDLFLPFKTPLCELYDDQVDKELRFHPEDVLNSPILNGRKIGLWCDFTKTDRFYFKNEIENKGCIYRKIKMEGHGASPTEDEVNQFILAVRTFLQNRSSNELVAVHCTHGFNRTGFAIVSYLVKEMDMSVEYAVQSFAAQRPCGIYKQDYINDLFKRFGDMEDCLEAPDRPSWELGENVSADFSLVPSTSQSNESKQGGQKQFMDGKVTNVFLVKDVTKKNQLRSTIQKLCGSSRDGFPGLQPVSLRRDNINLLASNKYMVSWKADGMRYMVYITEEGEVFAFDRDNEVFQIMGVDFPHRKEKRSVANTLIDCEMIIDVVKSEDGQEISYPRLLIYDIIQFEEFHLGKLDYNTRAICISKELIQPREEAKKNGVLRIQSMSVRKKDFWGIEVTEKLLGEKFTKTLGHEIDGLIFQPVDEPYKAGRCEKVLKWKPPSHNSIDFLLRIKKEQRTGHLPEYWGFLYVQHMSEPFAKIKATKKIQQFDNKIVECKLEPKVGWTIMRERTDKSLPNSANTAQNVYNSIIEPVDQDVLINFINKRCVRKRPAPSEADTQVVKKICSDDDQSCTNSEGNTSNSDHE